MKGPHGRQFEDVPHRFFFFRHWAVASECSGTVRGNTNAMDGTMQRSIDYLLLGHDVLHTYNVWKRFLRPPNNSQRLRLPIIPNAYAK